MANVQAGWQWITQNPDSAIGMLAAQVLVGASDSNEITVTATGIGDDSFNYVISVFLQAQQQWPQANEDFGYNDEFALQVIDSDLGISNGGGNSLTFRVKRLDYPGGWGQELVVNILIEVGLIELQ
jgi:hypothetical protein